MSVVHDSTIRVSQQGENSSSSSQLALNSCDCESALGTITNTASPSPIDRKKHARQLRFMLQSAARELLPSHRVAWCLRRLLPDEKTVDVMFSTERQKAYYKNLMTCAAIWECAVCASRITEERRNLLNDLLVQSQDRLAYGMLTFTVSHRQGESYEVVQARVLECYRRFTSGKWYQAFKKKYRILGTLKALEQTYGDNGWHVHVHVLIVSDSVFTPRVQLEMLMQGSKRWSYLVETYGGSWASAEHGLDIQSGNQHIGDYLNKLSSDVGHLADRWTLGDELTKAAVKRGRSGGRTLTELLYDYAVNGDLEAASLWKEAVFGLKGKKHLAPSRGFWVLLGRYDEVSSDADLADEEVLLGDRLLAALTLADWRKVIKAKARAELLNVASLGDENALEAFLADLGIDTLSGEENSIEGPGVADDTVFKRVVVDLDKGSFEDAGFVNPGDIDHEKALAQARLKSRFWDDENLHFDEQEGGV